MVLGRISGFFQFLLSNRRVIHGLRKRYDHLRERADRENSREKRIAVLKLLDQIEPTLTVLEEQQIIGFERNRMTGHVRSGLDQAKRMLGEKLHETRKGVR